MLHGRSRRADGHGTGTATMGDALGPVRDHSRVPAGVCRLPALRMAIGRVATGAADTRTHQTRFAVVKPLARGSRGDFNEVCAGRYFNPANCCCSFASVLREFASAV